MKIYERVVIDIETLEEIEEVHRAYEGPIALCGGGGGMSGEVVLPKSIEYTFNHLMYHERSQFDGGNDMVTDIIAAHDDNPFTNVNAVDPADELSAIDTEIGLYNTLIGALAEKADWASLMVQAATTIETTFATVSPNASTDITTAWSDPTPDAPTAIAGAWVDPSSDAPFDIENSWIDPTLNGAADIGGAWIDPAPAAEGEIAADVDAYEAVVDDHIESDVLPRFQRGMQSINAVMSSAFTIGQAIIEGMADRDIAKYQGQLRVAAFTQADEIKSRSELAESSRLADAHIQDDSLAVQSNIAESSRLADAHIQDDALLAQSKLGESNRIADAEIQDDDIVARGKLAESNRLADAHIQDDQISVAQAEQKNKMFMLSVAQMLQYFMRRVDGELQVSGLIMEANKLRIIVEKEEAAENAMLDESEGLWNFTIWQHAANMLAAPSGAAMVPGRMMTRQQSALTGAATGAATGAQVGGGYGAIVGAVAGGIGGYFY